MNAGLFLILNAAIFSIADKEFGARNHLKQPGLQDFVVSKRQDSCSGLRNLQRVLGIGCIGVLVSATADGAVEL